MSRGGTSVDLVCIREEIKSYTIGSNTRQENSLLARFEFKLLCRTNCTHSILKRSRVLNHDVSGAFLWRARRVLFCWGSVQNFFFCQHYETNSDPTILSKGQYPRQSRQLSMSMEMRAHRIILPFELRTNDAPVMSIRIGSVPYVTCKFPVEDFNSVN